VPGKRRPPPPPGRKVRPLLPPLGERRSITPIRVSQLDLPPPPPPPEPTKPFGNDIPTKAKGPALAAYQALLSVFDEMSPDDRMAFVELAYCFKELSASERTDVLEAVRDLTQGKSTR
jgi:hypothetical protein